MGFIISYKDIQGRPTKIPVPDIQKKGERSSFSGGEVDLLYFLQIDLCDTGKGYVSKGEDKERFQLAQRKQRPLASLTLKVDRKSLTQEMRTNE